MGLHDLTGKEQQFQHARGIRMGLQDLTGKEHQIEYAYKVSGWATGYHGLRTTDRTCLLGFRR